MKETKFEFMQTVYRVVSDGNIEACDYMTALKDGGHRVRYKQGKANSYFGQLLSGERGEFLTLDLPYVFESEKDALVWLYELTASRIENYGKEKTNNEFVATGLGIQRQMNVMQSSKQIKRILPVVLEYYGLTKNDFFSKSRKKPLGEARAVARYVLRELEPSLTYKQIGFATGTHDRTTVVYSINVIEGLLAVNDKTVTELVNKLRSL